MAFPVRERHRHYPARTPVEARKSLKAIEHDQSLRLISPERYLAERRRLIRLALMNDNPDQE